MEFKISELSDEVLAKWFKMVRSTAEKNIKAGVDGLKFWQKELKPNLSDGPLNGYMWAPVSQERIEAAAINPSHFVDQQVNIPKGPLTLRKFIQVAYNCGQGYDDPRTVGFSDVIKKVNPGKSAESIENIVVNSVKN